MEPQLSPHNLMHAYLAGHFPMAHEDGNIYWYDPDPRAILPLHNLHISRRLKRTIEKKPYDIYIDRDFVATMRGCAEATVDRQSTWIDENIIDAYTRLHQKNFAHSVEAWSGDRLVGGLYGVAFNGFFAGESMFSRERDASKICLVYLVDHLKQRGFSLLDVQFQTDHLKKFGVIEIPKLSYKLLLHEAIQQNVVF